MTIRTRHAHSVCHCRAESPSLDTGQERINSSYTQTRGILQPLDFNQPRICCFESFQPAKVDKHFYMQNKLLSSCDTAGIQAKDLAQTEPAGGVGSKTTYFRRRGSSPSCSSEDTYHEYYLLRSHEGSHSCHRPIISPPGAVCHDSNTIAATCVVKPSAPDPAASLPTNISKRVNGRRGRFPRQVRAQQGRA